MRYSRQELIIGKKAQEKLSEKTIAVVGLGAIGSVVCGILARAGVGKLMLIDRDIVELSNLQRQFFYEEKDVGTPKAFVTASHLKKVNSKIRINAIANDLDFKSTRILSGADIILDCTDNLETRFLINDYCLKNKKKWIYAAGIRSIGTVMAFSPEGPCFRCVFGNARSSETCETSGVLASTTTIVGSIQADMTIRLLAGKNVSQDMIRFDLDDSSFQRISAKKRAGCPACSGKYEYLKGLKGSRTAKLCGQGSYQIKGEKVNLSSLKKKLSRIGKTKGNSSFLQFKNLSLFSDGHAIIKARNEKEAKATYSKYVGN